MEAHQKIAEVLTKVWQDKDLDLLRRNLAAKVEWYEGPYAKALKSPDEVLEQWRKDLVGQEDVSANIELFAVDNKKASYHFRASWSDSIRGIMELDGVFLIRLNLEDKIEYFNQWYSTKPA